MKHSHLRIKVLKQEAGEVEMKDGTDMPFDQYPIGTILEVAAEV